MRFLGKQALFKGNFSELSTGKNGTFLQFFGGVVLFGSRKS